uniref:Pancreatic trypsin inhibitor n=1 Tax=Rhipicephalus appendiculatus TaxID=34631 RepID=A0A131YUH5_RHIAP
MQAARKDRMVIFVIAAILALSGVGFTKPKDRHRCDMPIEEAKASCHGGGSFEQRWGYNSSSGQCVKFWFSSCSNNINNFPNVSQCLETCNKNSQCLKKPGTTVVFPFPKSYYFDANKTECVERRTFKWTTSRNNNRFNTREECVNKCMPSTSILVTSQSRS